MNTDFVEQDVLFTTMLALLVGAMVGLAAGILLVAVGYTMSNAVLLVVGCATLVISLSGGILSYFWFTEPVGE